MSLALRSAQQNFHVDQRSVNKYHAEVSRSFDVAGIAAVQERLGNGATKFRFTQHCKQRSAEKHIPMISCERFLKEGKCFEYKLVGERLFRFAVRLVGKIRDYVAVFQPQVRNDGQVEVVVVTYYANSKDDQHRTLRTEEYCQ